LLTVQREVSATYSLGSSRQRAITDAIINDLVIGCGFPLSMMQNDHFRHFMSVDPKYRVPCRQTLSYSLIPKKVDEKRDNLKEHLASCTSVALTADIWTDRRCHSFIAVTGHTFQRGAAESHLLACKPMPGSHTGQNISEEMEAIVDEYDVRQKVKFVVTDNASNMLKAMYLFFPTTDDQKQLAMEDVVDDSDLWNDLEEEEHEASVCDVGRRLACFCHSLQLVIRSGLEKTSTCRLAFAKVLKLANMCHQSAVFRSAFEDKFGAGKSVPATNATRWNSVHHQLKSLLGLDQAKVADVLRQTSNNNLILTSKEVNQLTEVVSVLQPFAEATQLTQGEGVVTISCVVPVVLALRKFLGEKSATVTHLTGMVEELRRQLDIRFFHLLQLLDITVPQSASSQSLAFDNNIFIMAAALDPKYAYRWLVDHPGTAETKDALRHRCNGMCKL